MESYKSLLETRNDVLVKILDWVELNLNVVDEELNLTELMELVGLTSGKELDGTRRFNDWAVCLYTDSRS